MPPLIKIKQLLDRIAIACGIRNPGAKNRHDWVGPGSHDMNRKYQIDFLVKNGLLPEHTLIEIGCGTLRGGIPIIKFLNSGNYFGVDVRKSVLKEARAELSQHQLERKQPTIVLMMEAREMISRKADIIWAFHVLIHMNQERLKEAFEFVAEKLKSSGRFLATAQIGAEHEEEWQGFPVLTRLLETYAAEAARFNLEVTSLGGLESLGYGDYVHQKSRCSSEMLVFQKASNGI